MPQHCTCTVVIVYMYRYIYCSIISIMQYYAVLVLFHFPPSLLYTAQMHRAFCGALCHKMLCKISSDIIFIITKLIFSTYKTLQLQSLPGALHVQCELHFISIPFLQGSLSSMRMTYQRQSLSVLRLAYCLTLGRSFVYCLILKFVRCQGRYLIRTVLL